MLGIAIASAFTAGAAAEAVGTSFMTAQGVATVAELSVGARAGIMAAQMATDVTVTSLGQYAIQGGSLRHAFVENMFMTFASTALFGAFAHARKADKLPPAMTWKAAETLGQKAAVLGRETLGIGVHTLWGAAIGYVAGKVGGGPEPSAMQAREWMLQGASVFLGRRIHAALSAHMPSLQRLEARAEAKHLLDQAQQLQQLAARVEQAKNAELALELIERQTKFLTDEIELLKAMSAKHGDASGELGKTRADLESQLDSLNSTALLEPKFHLAGLHELIPGALWSGTREQIQNALKAASRGGTKPSQDPETKRWKLERDGRVIEIHEVADSADARAIARSAELDATGSRKPKPRMVSEVTSLDGYQFRLEFTKDLSPTARGLVRKLEKNGFVRITEITKEDLISISKWFGREVAVLQSPSYGKLRLVLGTERGILTKQVKKGEVFVVHTHPVLVSDSQHFAKDLQQAGRNLEAVVDWNGMITYYNKSGIKNPRPTGKIEPLLDYDAGFIGQDGTIIGFARVDMIPYGDKTTVKVR
jgi:hypothetical protein